MSDPQLKACPFCGGECTYHTTPGSWGYYPARLSAGCAKCRINSPGIDLREYDHEKDRLTVAQAKESAAAWWNRRAK